MTGTAQADIHVTGPGMDPRPKGEIRFTGGAFTVDATGVPYTGLNGRIELQDDRVHIASLGVVDNARSPLSLTGDVPIRRALKGDVKLHITARDFKVLDNKMGKVRINSDLQVAGELRAPHIEGELGVRPAPSTSIRSWHRRRRRVCDQTGRVSARIPSRTGSGCGRRRTDARICRRRDERARHRPGRFRHQEQ